MTATKEEIYNPLDKYRKVYKEKFLEVAAETFEELASASGLNVAKNKATCDELYSRTTILKKTKTKQVLWRLLCTMMYCLVVIAAIMVWHIVNSNYTSFTQSYDTNICIMILIIAAAIVILCLLIFKVHPKLKAIGTERDQLETRIQELTNMAWGQMDSLNKLYDWDIFARMMSKTVPKLEFDPFFTIQRLADLKQVYNWDESFNEGRSVLYSHSGLINGNPFVLCRTKKMEMGTKTYYGHKTIHWTTHYRDSNGKSQTQHHTQVLTGSYTAPYPEYYEKTRLIYGNIAAPDLCFSRTKNTFSSEQGSLSFKWKLHKLKKQAEKSTSNFVLMQNEKFEVLFNTVNRNHEQQFRLLFTPLAQESMLALLRDKEEGYGDDFDFLKNNMINIIVSDHIQSIEFDMNPAKFHHYDFELAKQNFMNLNANYFRAIYFCLAPLLCVPMYQQIRTKENIYGYGSKAKSAFWEHEALANFWGEKHFKHPQCATENILKTNERCLDNGNSVITVYAHGYKSVHRIYYDKVWGGDGRLHTVPVEWYEYLPVVGSGNIYMNEDTTDDSNLSPTQRQAHISNYLNRAGENGIYRRHIVSHL